MALSAFVISATAVSLFQPSVLQQSQQTTLHKETLSTFSNLWLSLSVDGHSHQNALLGAMYDWEIFTQY